VSKNNIRFQTLVDRAQREPIPPLDIVDRVAERIAPAPLSATRIEWSLWGAAGLSVAAAAAVLIIAFQQGVFFEDPLADWLRPLVVVMR
jgi:hypothetical protein